MYGSIDLVHIDLNPVLAVTFFCGCHRWVISVHGKCDDFTTMGPVHSMFVNRAKELCQKDRFPSRCVGHAVDVPWFGIPKLFSMLYPREHLIITVRYKLALHSANNGFLHIPKTHLSFHIIGFKRGSTKRPRSPYFFCR